MTIEPQGWALITTTITTTVTVIVGRAMYVWGKTTDTRNRVATNKSDGELITTRSNAAVFEDLATIAREGAETQKGVIRVVQRNTDAMIESAGVMTGMMTMLQANTIAINALVSHFPTLETNLEDTLNERVGPIVLALNEVGTQLKGLTLEFHRAEEQFIKALEELGEHHETHVENHKSIGSSTAD